MEAFARAVQGNNQARLYLVGTGEDSFVNKLRERIADNNITESVFFLGKRDNEEALDIISKCKVVVVPHQWPKEFGPVILLEAMALGKPVITSKIGATDEFVSDGEDGFLVEDYRSPKVFADKMQLLLDSRDMARKMGRKAKKSANSLLGEPCVEELSRLYASLVDGRKA